MISNQDLIDVQELAKLSGYTPQNITRKIRNGELKAVRRGRKYFLSKSSFKKLFSEPETFLQ